ncbi:MAG TPA: hypothetical protein HA224_04990 [Nanoarchaeota archaeon]|nr:hypothetical protein [Nanoarchaeota archaeon]
MANITLAVPEETFEKMKHFSEIRWSEVARKAIQQRIGDLEMLDKITAKSKLTKRNVLTLSKKINKAVTEKFLA